MTEANPINRAISRGRYAAAQGLRALWYGGHYTYIRRQSSGFTRPGEPKFTPQSGVPDLKAMRREFFKAYQEDLANIEAGLYPRPNDVRLGQLPKALRHSRIFLDDAKAVDERRLNRSGVEVRNEADPERYPTYYRQNFHYQSGGWFTDESADIYDTQVEVLFTGAADVMRRCVLGELARQMKGRDQRKTDVLDLACGTGRFLHSVLDTFPRLRATGLDLSPSYTEKARQAVKVWPQVDIVEGQAEAMPYDDNSQDLIVSIYLFHELPPKIRKAVAAEIQRVLKPGGKFIFADSLQFNDTPELDGLLEYFPEGFHEPYYKGYLKEDFDQLFGEVGLKGGEVRTAFLTRIQTWGKPNATDG
ncbi:MAG: SAM-dependent methyltransferase [Ponticaulis sp.]|nr:SAM-dependent methyltransferase [Ponticaulis sp.]|tara:strand:- start:8497 stop:9576 length:1080 start_codon:yes stop_codon:yes gene_type:complete